MVVIQDVLYTYGSKWCVGGGNLIGKGTECCNQWGSFLVVTKKSWWYWPCLKTGRSWQEC